MAGSFSLDIRPDTAGAREVAVVLPCGPEEFNDFIAGLLGRPQEITGIRLGRFRVDLVTAMQVHDLIVQRVAQQHGAAPLQFSARILFQNGTSVLLNSVDDFQRYAEVRAITSVGLLLSWSFLIHFQGAKSPEKQEIEISFIAHHRATRDHYLATPMDFPDSGRVFYRIMHTARTWGADIEALLTHYIDNLIASETPLRKYIREHSLPLSFVSALLMFAALVVGMAVSSSHVQDTRAALLAPAFESGASIALKLDVLARYIEATGDPTAWIYRAFFLVAAFLISVLTGIIVEVAASKHPEADVVFTTKAEQLHAEHVRKSLRSPSRTTLSLLGALLLAVASNAIYDFALKKELQQRLTEIVQRTSSKP
jgi:hypothetical protein